MFYKLQVFSFGFEIGRFCKFFDFFIIYTFVTSGDNIFVG